MHERYTNRKIYFTEQGSTTEKYVIPYINQVRKIDKNSRVLEVGCGEGGNLTPFVQMGCNCVGVELEKGRSDQAIAFFKEMGHTENPVFYNNNIYDVSADKIGQFDLIFLRDVIEHIPQQDKLLAHLKTLLKDDGVIFFGFPPWQMPFGGHQQVSTVKWIRKMPYVHLLPFGLYKWVLKKGGEYESVINDLMDVKATGISIERFSKIVKQNGFVFKKKTQYFINPNYEIKFGLKTREKIPILGDIPYLKNYVTTCLYAVIGKK